MLSFVTASKIFHILLIQIWFHVRLLLLPINTIFLNKILNDIDTMIAPFLWFNFIIRYNSNRGHLRFLVHRALLYFHDSELIRDQILLTPILKPQQEPPLKRGSLDHTSQLLPQPPGKQFPYLLLQLIYLCLHHLPHHDLVPPPCISAVCGGRAR